MFFNISFFLVNLKVVVFSIFLKMATDQANHHVNLDFLKEISEGSTDLMRDLINLFITQVPIFSEQMELYLKNQDYCTLAKLAHKIKNSVAMMGIDELTSDMKKLENICTSNPDNDTLKAYVERFKKISGEASIELQHILESL